MIIQGFFFSNSMIFQSMEQFLVIFQVFQSLWEPWLKGQDIICLDLHLPTSKSDNFTTCCFTKTLKTSLWGQCPVDIKTSQHKTYTLAASILKIQMMFITFYSPVINL